MPRSGPPQDPERSGGTDGKSGDSLPLTHRGTQTPSTLLLVSEIGWEGIDAANTVTGFPWSGYEEHWREGDIVESKAEVTGYHRHEHAGEEISRTEVRQTRCPTLHLCNRDGTA